MSSSRQLAAIMFTDIVGYTALMGADDARAFQLLDKNRALQKPLIAKHHGRFLKEMGDGILSSFGSVLDAVLCASSIQIASKEVEDLALKIAIHIGEVTFSHQDVFGDGVNVASRIESIATAGSILISDKVNDEILNQKSIQTQYVGTFEFKNVPKPMPVYAIATPGLMVPEATQLKGKLKEPLAAKKSIEFFPLRI